MPDYFATVNGIVNDAEEAETIFQRFREFLSDHKLRVNFSSFSGPDGGRTNFHGAGDVPVEAAPVTPQATTGASAETAQADPAPETGTVPAGPSEEEDPPAE